MNKRIDVVVDLETLGRSADALIFQIGAIAFDIETGQILSEFNEIADLSDSKDLLIEGNTLLWWLKTDSNLLNRLLNNPTEKGLTPKNLLFYFESWIAHLNENINNELGNKNVYLWGNGILFDNAKLKHQLTNIDKNCVSEENYPIYYRNDRDIRTLVESAMLKTGKTRDEIYDPLKKEDETLHDALDDCRFEVRLINYCYNALLK